MNNATKELYIKYAQLYKTHASQYADTLTGSANNDFYLLLQSEYKKDLKEITRREREQLKVINKLHKMKVKADKRILSKRKSRVDFDFNKLFAEQIQSKVDEYLAKLISDQNEAVDEPTTDETAETEQVNEETETPSDTTTEPTDEAKPTKETKQEPTCCKECTSCKIDENEQCYCSKYDVDIDASDANSICYCEQDDFFGESDE